MKDKEITFTVNAPKDAAKWTYTIAKTGSTNIAEVDSSDLTVSNLTDATAKVTVKLKAADTAPVIKVTTAVTDYVLNGVCEKSALGEGVMAVQLDARNAIPAATGMNDYSVKVVLENALVASDKVVVKYKVNGGSETAMAEMTTAGQQIQTGNIDLGSPITKKTTVEITSVTVFRAITHTASDFKIDDSAASNLTTASTVKLYKEYTDTKKTAVADGGEAFAVGTKLYVVVTGGTIDTDKKVTYTFDGVAQTTGDATEELVWEYTVQDKDNISFNANNVVKVKNA